MRIAKRDKVWLLGGLVIALVLVAVAWEFVISGQYSHTNSLRSQTADANSRASSLRAQASAQQADNLNLPAYKAALAAAQQALPANTGMSAFLRELHATGTANGMTVLELQVSEPVSLSGTGAAGAAADGTTATSTPSATSTTPATSGGIVSSVSGPVYEVPVTMISSGPFDDATAFLKQIQQLQPRAVLIISNQVGPGANAGQVSMKTDFEVFVAPSDGATPVASE